MLLLVCKVQVRMDRVELGIGAVDSLVAHALKSLDHVTAAGQVSSLRDSGAQLIAKVIRQVQAKVGPEDGFTVGVLVEEVIDRSEVVLGLVVEAFPGIGLANFIVNNVKHNGSLNATLIK